MKFLKPIVCSVLALLVLVSSSSFTVNMHFCGGSVQSVSLIEKATPCPMEVKTPPCHKAFAKRSSCCDDEQFLYQGQDFKNHEVANIQVVQQAWVIELPVLAQIVPIATAKFSHYTLYKPPLLQHDIPVLIQSFLI